VHTHTQGRVRFFPPGSGVCALAAGAQAEEIHDGRHSHSQSLEFVRASHHSLTQRARRARWVCVFRYVRAANVGDSCFMVVRRGRVLFRSPSQQHEFNFPFQLGGEGSDKVSDAQCFMVPVQVGDVVVMGTDGLFDNVFDKDVALMAARGLKVRVTASWVYPRGAVYERTSKKYPPPCR